MSVVALIGDCTTTTALALAAGWPEPEHLVVESDRRGGSVSAWLGVPATPTLSTIVASIRSAERGPTWASIESFVHCTGSGIRFVSAPVRGLEANRAIAEAETSLFPLLARLRQPTVIADVGRHTTPARLPTLAELAAAVVVCHHQRAASPGATGVRLERCAELIESLAGRAAPIVLAVIGDRPFDLAEIHRFAAEIRPDIISHALGDDPLAAAVLAGRSGVSARRLARLPLMRSACSLAGRLHTLLPRVDDEAHDDRADVAPGAGSETETRDSDAAGVR